MANAERVYRIDQGHGLRSPVRTPQGFLRVEGYVARAGIYEYVNTERDAKAGHGPVGTIRRELRPESEVFRADALAGFEGASLTAYHPTQPVTAQNARAYEVGNVNGAARREADRVVVSMTVKDPKTIAKVEKGELVRLSPGYGALIERTPGADKRYATPGNPEGRYDCVQRSIEINHLALVPRARGGDDLCVRMDGADHAVEQRVDAQPRLTNAVEGHQHLIDLAPDCQFNRNETSWAVADGAENGHTHPWVRNADGSISIGESAGHTHTVLEDSRYAVTRNDAAPMRQGASHMADPMQPEEQIRLLQAKTTELEQRAVAAEAKAKEQETRADTAEQQLDVSRQESTDLRARIASGITAAESEALSAMQTRLDTADRELAELRAAIPGQVRARAELVHRAVVVCGPEFRTDGLSDRALNDAVIRHYEPRCDLGELNDTKAAARASALYERRTDHARSLTRAGDVLADRRNDAAPTATTAPVPYRDRWKQGAGEFATSKRQKEA